MNDSHSIVMMMFLMFGGAAVLSTVALYTRQSLLVAYILLGVLLGPWGLGLVHNADKIAEVGDIGIVFLLFLLGLHLHPQNLMGMLKKVCWIGLVSSLLFALMGYSVAIYFAYSNIESLVIAVAMMFSSTIIGLKLLPTTVLHHQHTGELMISVLLMQDIIAIIVLLVLQAAGGDHVSVMHVAKIAVAFPVLILVSYVFQHFILIRLLEKFDKVQEYIFMLSIGWCLAMAELAQVMGLSHDIGAFIAGVAIAAHPISLYIAESLKPLRDFFLLMFFFSVGASFNFGYLDQIYIPAIVLALMCLCLKPAVFKFLFRQVKEPAKVSWEVGVRLGQISEFSLLIVFLASESALISEKVVYLVQAATMLTFIVSCYFVVLKYPTPLALTDNMRRD
jgi:Kef-type K+ transport system membrane component KefB